MRKIYKKNCRLHAPKMKLISDNNENVVTRLRSYHCNIFGIQAGGAIFAYSFTVKRHLQVIIITRQGYFLIGTMHASFLGHAGHGWYTGYGLQRSNK